MAVRSSRSPDRAIFALIDDELSPEAQSRSLADAAREAIDEAAAQNARALGRVPPHETTVDGRLGAPLDSVSPRGVIVAEFDLFEDMLQWIGRALVEASPTLTGRYARSHVFTVDGVEIADGAALPVRFEEAAFVNLQPYARKIERGQSDQAPDGVYQAVAVTAAKRFGNLARIRFSYRAPLFGAVDEWAGKTGMKSRSKGARRAERLRRQPAIVVTPR